MSYLQNPWPVGKPPHNRKRDWQFLPGKVEDDLVGRGVPELRAIILLLFLCEDDEAEFTPQRILQEDGTEIEGLPPHPNFCMKGRSINELLQEVDLWHEELSGLEDIQLEQWDVSGFREFEHIAVDPEMKRNLQWTVHELTTSA